jgi:hypothetical protein
MPGGLPGVQRQHQPTLWNLRSLRLLHDVRSLLQRSMHQREVGSTQLRRVRQCLRRINSGVHPGDMRQLPAGIYKLQWFLR